ncbi:IPT/TIG domain-containing protein [Streptomyces sp. NPDC047108]|uniref:IPT/TIG domain-containing protein n=1 Tax=Streptomyces sp. NPDC047108 TaxID=3155025 RepID=UPI0033D1ABCE
MALNTKTPNMGCGPTWSAGIRRNVGQTCRSDPAREPARRRRSPPRQAPPRCRVTGSASRVPGPAPAPVRPGRALSQSGTSATRAVVPARHRCVTGGHRTGGMPSHAGSVSADLGRWVVPGSSPQPSSRSFSSPPPPRSGRADAPATGSTEERALPALAVATVPVGRLPRGVAVEPVGRRAYIANSGSGSVSVVDTGSLAVTTAVGPVAAPAGVASVPESVSPSVLEALLYVADSGSDTVTVLDRSSYGVIGSIAVGLDPCAVVVGPNGLRAYVSNAGSDTLSVIDTPTNTVTATIPVGRRPSDVAVHPSSFLVYVANQDSDSVSVIDRSTDRVADTINGLSSPIGLAITPDGSTLFVANNGADTVSVIDTAENVVAATVPVGSRPWGVAISPDGHRAFVTNNGDDSVSIIDTDARTVVATPSVGKQPTGVAVNPTGLAVYVANTGSDTASVIQILNSMGPNRGPMSGGTTVTITGTNLASTTRVAFDAVPATLLARTANQLTVVSPPGAGVAQVTVTTPGGTSNPKPFFYYPGADLQALEPVAGPATGANTITLRGDLLDTATRVFFGAIPALPRIVSSEEIQVIAPVAVSAGMIPVSVATAGGTTPSLAYTYVNAPRVSGLSSTSGSMFGGAVIAATGRDLATTSLVTVGERTARFSVVSDTQLAIVIPSAIDTGTVPVSVTTAGGTATAPVGWTYT